MITSSKDLYFKKHIFFCINARPPGNIRGCCAEKNSEKMQIFMKTRCKELNIKDIRINNSGCLNRCELGPIMVIYPEGVWYSYQNEQDIEEIIDQHILKDKIVPRLQLTNMKNI
jgi:(2Fe-2S) ferredoxin